MSALKNLYMNSLINARYTFRDGTEAIFLNGEYLTDKQKQIAELDEEIEAGHPYIYKVKGKEQVDTTFVDPMEAIKAKVREELLAEAAALRAGISNVEDSKSDQNAKIVVGNTTTVGEAMAGSSSGAGQVAGAAAQTGQAVGGTGATVIATPATGHKIVAGPRPAA